nr:flippase [uncultured Methanobacterium sp.]
MKNIGVLFIGQIVIYLLSFFFTIITARYLGVQGYGVLSFAIAFTGLFAVLADFGLSTLMIREVAREKNLVSKYLGNIVIIKTILVLMTCVLIVLIINLMGYPKETIEIVSLFALCVGVNAFTTIFYAVFQAFEKMEYQSFGQIINSVLILSGSLLLIHFGYGILEYALLYLIVSLIVLVYSTILCIKKFTIPRLEVDWDFWKRLLLDAWPMGGMAIFIMIYFRIDVIMLSLMVGQEAVGFYSAAYQLSELTTVIPTMFITSMFPLMSRFFENSKSSFMKTYAKSTKYLAFVAILMAFIVTVIANPIISLVFGENFSGSVFALQIIIWSAAIMYITMLQGNVIITANKQLFSFKITIMAAIFNIALNLILIPHYSYIGASLATLITEAFGLMIGMFFLNKWGYKINILDTFLPPVLALLGATAVTVIMIKLTILNSILVAIIASFVYGIIIYKFGINSEDKLLITNIINSVKR